jgi:heterogeneous nuclear ribonucleoprotein A1/A3|uniref:RRM domain-containing protein n=1 Tax=Panagrolaimus sp. PS1159 TaxID=55785 RepID=A0AC35F858_9BILA
MDPYYTANLMAARAAIFPLYNFPTMNSMINPFNSIDVPAQMRKLFIGGLTHETTDEQLRGYYSQFGQIVDCIIIRDPVTKNSRGFGFVTYATMHQADIAMNNRPHTINNKVVDPKRAIPREQMLPMAISTPYFLNDEPSPDCKVYLSGIHWDYHTVDEIRQHFQMFGNIEQVEILGNPRGAGFIVYDDVECVKKCKAHGMVHIINGKHVEIRTDPSIGNSPASSAGKHHPQRRRHKFSGSQGYNSQQNSRTSTPSSISSTEYPALGSNR